MSATRNYLLNSKHRNKVIIGAVAAAAFAYYIVSRRKGSRSSRDEGEAKDGKPVRDSAKFYSQLRRLLPIVIPGIWTKEFGILVLHTAFLVSRTGLSLYVSHLDGQIVKALVARDGKEFTTRLLYWLGIAIPATYCNSMIKFLESKLSIALRTRLTMHTYELYMKNETYYRIGNLDSRLANPDQCLTEDINNFCSHLANIHSQISKPILDIFMNTWQLIRMSRNNNQSNGAVSTSLMLSSAVIFITAKILQFARPKFGQLVAKQAALEGELRTSHAKLITNAEEIAFYRGHAIEKKQLFSNYFSLIKHMNLIFKKKIGYTMLESFLMKYVWSSCGLLMIALPAFYFSEQENTTSDVISNRTANYITAKNLLISGAEAVERIMLAYKKISQLAGYTGRVSDMLDVFDDVSKGKYQKTTITTTETPQTEGEEPSDEDKLYTTIRADILAGKRGVVTEADFIRFENVPIVSPNNDILVPNCTFETRQGQHLLITGPNGCGKSSLFRCLGGLWPVLGGKLTRPEPSKLFYIPQRPYLVNGTLRDQIIYPDTVEDMKKRGVTDAELMEIMKYVHLDYIVERETWDKCSEWKDILSGGEKQRVGLARVFYHKPLFAILDECTSAVSIDVEGKIYQKMIDAGVTLLTVTHRPTLWKYHNYLLQFDGEGHIKFSELNAQARLSLKEEKSHLEQQLSSVAKMNQRLGELCKLLGEDSVVLQKKIDNSSASSRDESADYSV